MAKMKLLEMTQHYSYMGVAAELVRIVMNTEIGADNTLSCQHVGGRNYWNHKLLLKNYLFICLPCTSVKPLEKNHSSKKWKVKINIHALTNHWTQKILYFQREDIPSWHSNRLNQNVIRNLCSNPILWQKVPNSFYVTFLKYKLQRMQCCKEGMSIRSGQTREGKSLDFGFEDGCEFERTFETSSL